MGDETNLKQLVGQRVHDYRVQAHLTQAQFAESIDISINFLSEVENGKKGMSQETLYRLCKQYHISADYILFGSQQTVSAEQIPSAPDQLVQLANGLSLRELDFVIQYLNSLRKIKELHL